MPPPAACARSATMADTMLPAAPVATTTESGPSVSAGIRRRRGPVLQADGETDPAPPADLDGTAVAERLVDEHGCHLGRPGIGLDVDHLHRRRRTLARQRLGEPAHGAGHRAPGTSLVVAMGAAVAGRASTRNDPARIQARS